MGYNQANGGAALLAFARQLTGKPYVYGGTWPGSGGTDCDGLWNWAGDQMGVTIRRPTGLGFLDDPWDQRNGHRDDPWEAGDLGWIAGADGTPTSPGHVWGYVSPGQIFQAEETGVNIGQFPADTTVFDFRTRPALQLPLADPTVPDSPAAHVNPRFRPAGIAPTLTYRGVGQSLPWIRYLRMCLRDAKAWPKAWPTGPGGYGRLTHNAVVRYERDHPPLAPDGECTPRIWKALGVIDP